MEDTGQYQTGADKVSVELTDGNLILLGFNAPGINDDEHNAMANEVSRKFNDIKQNNPNIQSFKVLVNLTNAGVPSESARSIYIKTLSDKQIVKTAFWGAGSAISAVVSFIVSVSGRGDDVKFFVSEEEARSWLALN